jgi:hypothetical protein
MILLWGMWTSGATEWIGEIHVDHDFNWAFEPIYTPPDGTAGAIEDAFPEACDELAARFNQTCGDAATGYNSNGCGQSGILGQFIPETSPFGSFIHLGGACDNHDRCYTRLGEDRMSCDTAIRYDIEIECNQAMSLGEFRNQCLEVYGNFGPGASNMGQCIQNAYSRCYGVASAYSAATQIYGAQPFQAAQHKAACISLKALMAEHNCPAP